MTDVFRQNDDGSWTPAEPVGWHPGIDWEASRGPDGIWEYVAYEEDVTVAVVTSRWQWLAIAKQIRAHRKLVRK